MDKMLSTPVSDAEVAPKMDRRSVRGTPVEVIVRAERRRVWTPQQKRDIVAESLGPDLTPTEVARKYGIGSGLLYTWRQQILTGPMDVLTRSAPNFAQVKMASGPLRLEASPPSPDEPMSPPAAPAMPRPDGLIEIVLPDGVSLRVEARVDVKALRRVLGVFREQ
jgi:transposase